MRSIESMMGGKTYSPKTYYQLVDNQSNKIWGVKPKQIGIDNWQFIEAWYEKDEPDIIDTFPMHYLQDVIDTVQSPHFELITGNFHKCTLL